MPATKTLYDTDFALWATQTAELMRALIKQHAQPERDGTSWSASIADARAEMLDDLTDSPSLRPYLDENLQRIYLQAVKQASLETEFPAADLPEQCPYALDFLLGDE